MNTNIKPFYIYTDRNSLYIKNINESAERLASNIYAYSANIDKDNNIHILAIDSIGRVIHFFNNEGIWKKKIIRKYFNSVRNIKDMRLYILNDYFNVFVVEKYPLDDNLYKISHLNFNISNYNMFRHTIDKVFKDSSSIYKLNIDELSKLINLKWLNLNNNKVKNIARLSNLTNLQRLYLSNNQIKDIGVLSELTNLQ